MSDQKTYSVFLSQVHSADGTLKHHNIKKNLTTDNASGYTNRRDWQAKAMGGGVWPGSEPTLNGAATGTTSNTLTNSGANFPTSGQKLAGATVAVGPNSSGTGSTVFGTIVSNTSTVLTVDQWSVAGTMAAGTTPNATATYQVLPGQSPAIWLALTSDATTPADTDTTLTSELTTNGFARAIGIFAHTAAATTYTLTHLFTATGTATINKEAVFSAANSTAGGAMPFESAEPSPPTLVSGDTLTQTITITIN